MKRVTGIGGIFFKARDADALRAWYRKHLGIAIEDWGGVGFSWQRPADAPEPDGGVTVFSIFKAEGSQLPSKASFMINFRVEDLKALLTALRAEGCAVDEKTDSSEYGDFGWVIDPEGNKIELWQPPKSG